VILPEPISVFKFAVSLAAPDGTLSPRPSGNGLIEEPVPGASAWANAGGDSLSNDDERLNVASCIEVR
jgi:hypothetical protein